MFRPMRKESRALSVAEAEALLRRATSGVLSLHGDDGYPYGVPVSHVYQDGHIWFHCAVEGHKLDAIQACPKVCFTVVTGDEPWPEKFTTRYESAIAFGTARILTDPAEKMAAMDRLLDKFCPGLMEEGRKQMVASMDHTCLVEITVEHLTGKTAHRKIAAGNT